MWFTNTLFFDAYYNSGVFISQADTSLVLATYGEIASQFGHLESASWLLSTYMLAMCVGQPLVSLFYLEN